MTNDPRTGFEQPSPARVDDGTSDANGRAAARQDDAPPRANDAGHEPGNLMPARSTDSIVRALAASPGELARLIDGKPADTLMQPSQDGGWGIVEVIPHMRDWELIHAERVARILSEERPHFTEQDDALWAIERHYREQDTRAALDEFRRLREALVDRLEGLDEAQWARTATHPRLGEISLHVLMDRVCDHDAKHVQQVRDILG